MATIPFEEWPADIQAMSDRLGNTDVVGGLREDLSTLFHRAVRSHFMGGTNPWGEAWPPHRPSTIARHGPHPLLILTGKLLDAAGGGPGSTVEIHDNEIAWSIDVPTEDGSHNIAAIQNYGAPRANIPDREFWALGESSLDEVEELIVGYVEREVFQ
jgi:phage gpG-like protein